MVSVQSELCAATAYYGDRLNFLLTSARPPNDLVLDISLPLGFRLDGRLFC